MSDGMLKIPEDYEIFKKIDISSNLLNFLVVNVISLLIFIILFLGGMIFGPKILEINFVTGSIGIISILLYLFLNFYIKGYLIKSVSKVKPFVIKKKPFILLGSNSYFTKKEYIIISITPFFIIGILLTVAMFLVPEDWFWNIYTIWVLNIVMSIRDINSAIKLLKMTKKILIVDKGEEVIFYQEKEELQ